MGDDYGVIKGDTRSLYNGSCVLNPLKYALAGSIAYATFKVALRTHVDIKEGWVS